MCGKCYPITDALIEGKLEIRTPKSPKWRVIAKISERMYVLCATFDSHVRFAPFYIHSFRLCAPHKLLEATMMNQTYHAYEEITSIPDRLRWLRHRKGLMQWEAAQIAGVSRSVYIQIEGGITRRLPGCLILNLSQFYGVPVSDFLDEYNRFLFDGQAKRIKDYRKKLGMGRKPFCRHTGVPLSSLRGWEDGKKEVSFKCWEMYFKGRA